MPLRANLNINRAIERDDEDQIPLVEVDDVPVIFADGPAKVEINGDVIEVTYARQSTLDGRKVRLGVLKMIRPVRNCGKGGLWELISRALAHVRPDHPH